MYVTPSCWDLNWSAVCWAERDVHGCTGSSCEACWQKDVLKGAASGEVTAAASTDCLYVPDATKQHTLSSTAPSLVDVSRSYEFGVW